MSKAIKTQWEQMINRGTMPLFEIQIAESHWLIVDLEMTEQGIGFSFDTAPIAPYNPLPVSFDGGIVKLGEGVYLMPFDECTSESLDEMLQTIDDNITEGFLIPNNLFYSEE